jgi:ubiquitin carboxyl-terminal hydrolase 5/13
LLWKPASLLVLPEELHLRSCTHAHRRHRSTHTTPQVLLSLPEVAQRYTTNAEAIFSSAPADAASDLPTQLAKVGVALVSGRTGKPPLLPDAAGAAGEGEPQPMDGVEAAAAPAPADAAHAGGGQAETAAQEANSVRPAAFKALVGKGHPEFSSGRQQVCSGWVG